MPRYSTSSPMQAIPTRKSACAICHDMEAGRQAQNLQSSCERSANSSSMESSGVEKRDYLRKKQGKRNCQAFIKRPLSKVSALRYAPQEKNHLRPGSEIAPWHYSGINNSVPSAFSSIILRSKS